MKTTYTVTATGRHFAPQRYNRTMGRWLDGGADLAVEIRDDDTGEALTSLSDDALLTLAEQLHYGDRDDTGEIADAVAEEIERRLQELSDQIDGWDGESARALASALNDADLLAERATDAMSYIPGRPHGYRFEPSYDVTSLGWYGDDQPTAEHIYACDKHGVYVVLVAGTTDDGWTTEDPDADNA